VNVLLWIAQSLLAVAFLVLGAMKLFRTRAQLASTFAWVEQFPDSVVKTIGTLEALVGLGLVLPGAVGIASILVPVAGVGGLALVIGGTAVHLRRAETALAAMNLMYIALLALVVWGRFGPYRF